MIEQSIYVMQNDKGLVKIGISKEPKIRKIQLEEERNEKIKLIYYTDKYINASTVERKLHRYFKNYNYAGEWFKINIEDAITNVQKASYSIAIKQYKDIPNEKYFYNDEVRLSNKITDKLVNNYSVAEIKTLLYIINRIQVNKPLIINKENIKMAHKGKYSKTEYKEILSRLNNTELIKKVDLDDDYYKVDIDKELIDPQAYNIIHLEEVKEMKSKYDVGIYIKCKSNLQSGKAFIGVDNARKYFGNDLETYLIVGKIKQSVKRVSEVLGVEVKIKTYKQGNKTVNIAVEFPKYLYKSRCRNNKPILKDYYTEDEILF